jgi:hypothetical protein
MGQKVGKFILVCMLCLAIVFLLVELAQRFF